MNPEGLDVGQEVRVFPLHGDDAPEAGWPATITAVGDELATAAVRRDGVTWPVVFSVRDLRSTDGGQWLVSAAGTARPETGEQDSWSALRGYLTRSAAECEGAAALSGPPSSPAAVRFRAEAAGYLRALEKMAELEDQPGTGTGER